MFVNAESAHCRHLRRLCQHVILYLCPLRTQPVFRAQACGERQLPSVGVLNHDSELAKKRIRSCICKQLLAVAETYLFHADRLIYSYGSKTFLSGYAIYDEDYDGRGNIDCSTFLLLVLHADKAAFTAKNSHGCDRFYVSEPL